VQSPASVAGVSRLNVISNGYPLDTAVRLRVKVVAGCSRSELAGWLGDVLKVRISAQPEKGKANAAVLALLAGRLGISMSSLNIASGKTSQHKVLEIYGLSISEVRRKLSADGA